MASSCLLGTFESHNYLKLIVRGELTGVMTLTYGARWV